jgi:hypothetical protein
LKQLLIKGADRNALDFKGLKPIDYVTTYTNIQLKNEVEKLLIYQWTVYGDFLMIKPVFKNKKKSAFTMWFYFGLMFFSFFCLENSSYYILR